MVAINLQFPLHQVVSDDFDNIPEELKSYPQWILWRYEDHGQEKPTKVPYSTKGYRASVVKPETWCSFESAVNHIRSCSGYSGIGFVLTKDDPFCFVDLDHSENQETIDKQIKLVQEFSTYSERSPSGKGLHMICKGKIDGGRRKNKIEIYDNERYMTMTGDIFCGYPIAERQDLCTALFSELKASEGQFVKPENEVEKYSDDEIYKMASEADNGEKFLDLFSGNWEKYYPPEKEFSQSEADFALINIISFYSRNYAQIERIFKYSALGKRKKANRRKYINEMIEKSFDNQGLEVNFNYLKQQMDSIFESKPEKNIVLPSGEILKIPDLYQDNSANWDDIDSDIYGTDCPAYPPGLVGEIAEQIYQCSPRPVRLISLVAALGLMAGLAGRAYNVSGTGLNQYFIMLGFTGVGKEAIANGIDKIEGILRKRIEKFPGFIGPAEIASAQALIKHLKKNPSFVSIFGEYAIRLKQMSAMNASENMLGLKRLFLDLYNKSGHNRTLRAMIYSQKDNNVDETKSPAFSIVCESSPEIFWSTLNQDMIAEGLIPRFSVLEYRGLRPDLNEGHQNHQIPEDLISKLISLSSTMMQMCDQDKVIEVVLTDHAYSLSKAFDYECTQKINGKGAQEVTRQLWNRAHVKVLKLASLVAVGINPYQPTICENCFYWAKNLIVSEIENVMKHFDNEDIKTQQHETKQITEVKKSIYRYLKCQASSFEKQKINPNMHKIAIIPYAFMQVRALQYAAFKDDKLGATAALKRTLKTLCDSGELTELTERETQKQFQTKQKLYAVNEPSKFLLDNVKFEKFARNK